MSWIDLHEGILEEFAERQGLHNLADSFASGFGTTISSVGLYEERKFAGECVDCGTLKSSGGVRCKSCKIKSQKNVDTRRSRNVKPGACRQCGRALDTDKLQCSPCLSKALTQAKSYYEANKDRVLAKAKEKRAASRAANSLELS